MIEDINAKILYARIKEMEKDGRKKREVIHETSVRIEYTITEKGAALQPILIRWPSFRCDSAPKTCPMTEGKRAKRGVRARIHRFCSRVRPENTVMHIFSSRSYVRA